MARNFRADIVKLSEREETHVKAFRRLQCAIEDPDNSDGIGASKYVLDQLMGKAGQAIEITGTTSMHIAYTPDVAKLLGVETVQARVVDEDGGVKDIDIGPED